MKIEDELTEYDEFDPYMVGATKHRLMLASHPGKAVVYKYENKSVALSWFLIGHPQQAIEVQISKNFADG